MSWANKKFKHSSNSKCFKVVGVSNTQTHTHTQRSQCYKNKKKATEIGIKVKKRKSCLENLGIDSIKYRLRSSFKINEFYLYILSNKWNWSNLKSLNQKVKQSATLKTFHFYFFSLFFSNDSAIRKICNMQLLYTSWQNKVTQGQWSISVTCLTT